MTTEKKSSFSEKLKALRDKAAGMIAAAEEEGSSVADSAWTEDPAAISSVMEPEEKDVVRRASDDAVASALRKFTWASKEDGPRENEEKGRDVLDDLLDEMERGDEPSRENEPEEELPEEETALEQILKEELAQEKTQAAEEPEPLSEEQPLSLEEILREERSASDSEFTAVSSAVRDEQESSEDHKPAAEDDTGFLQEAHDTIDGNELKPEEKEKKGFSWGDVLGGLKQLAVLDEEEPGEGEIPEQSDPDPASSDREEETEQKARAAAFSGFADLLAGLKSKAGKRKEQQPVEEAPDISMFLEEDAEEGDNGSAAQAADDFEPDPEEVARLWEPKGEKKTAAESAGDPSVDPNKEETHVFTEEDLKNLPREETDEEQQGDEAEESLSPSDYLEDDEEESYTPRDFRPIRRRRYYRTGLVGGIMYFLFVICVSVALACFAWLAADDMLSLNKEYLEAEVYVGEDMDVGQIATELKTKGLIRYRRLFELFGKFFHADEKIEPGTYTLSTKLDYRALIQNMHHYTGWTGEELKTVKVTIPEGKTVMETFQILAEHGVCPYETLMECAAKESFDYAFLEDMPKGDATRLEGYLFPDTYEFYADSSPKAAICRFLDNFGDRIGERVTEQAAAQGYTLREILIVASLIEKEAGNDLERAKIASVIYNRLQSSSYQYLQIDATIQYAMGEHKEHLTYDDLQVDSPYNTYLYPGLPPGPIANPGLASIRAALSPENTGYYFYALNKNGKHEFFSSYNEFQRFINSSNFGG